MKPAYQVDSAFPLRGTVKWVSVFGLSMVGVGSGSLYRRTDTQPSRLGSAAAWRRSTFIKCQLDFNKDYYYYNGATNLGALKGGGH